MRRIYLICFAQIYTCAFLSILLQYRGLLGENGLLPAEEFWKQIKKNYEPKQLPSLLWFCDQYFDLTVEGIALSGLLVSMLAQMYQHALLYAFMFMAYLTIFTIGQTFLSFQWDILLLEAGAATILYAPFLTLKVAPEHDDEGHPALWILRSIVVKLLILSGVVKVNAQCPTWKYLTALEFHFASTCLPTAEGWFLHSFPPILLRFGVAVMFLIELVAPWLMLIPITPIRRAGVIVQIPLQVLIQFSGNYNFFNLLTLVLLIPAWAHDFAIHHFWERSWQRLYLVCYILTFAALTYTFLQLFPFVFLAKSDDFSSLLTKSVIRFDNLATESWTRKMIQITLSSLAVHIFYAIVSLTAVSYSFFGTHTLKQKLRRCMLSVFCLGYLALILVPYRSILDQDLPLPYAAQAALRVLEPRLGPFRVSSSYGLFRRMTGVGSTQESGWAGVPLASKVAVPAVVIEVSTDNGASWLEIPFRYAPYKPDRPPRRTAPHQPRIDWQMWFAALGSYQYNPWFLHLLYRLILFVEYRKEDPVIDLLDLHLLNKKIPSSTIGKILIRAWRYEYDFTRVPSPWALSIPGTKLSACTPDFWPHSWHLDSFPANRTSPCRDYWTRAKISEYVPTVDKALLFKQVIQPQGWPAHSYSSDKNVRPSSFFSFATLAYIYNEYLGGSTLCKFVGFNLPCPPGLACIHDIYIDGPLLLTLMSLTLPWYFTRIYNSFSARFKCYRSRKAYARSKKHDDDN